MRLRIWQQWMVVLAGLATLGLAGCAGTGELPLDVIEDETAAEQSTPLGGEALAQRKREMLRAHRDMIQFYRTLDSMDNRQDRNGMVLLSEFLDQYMGMHLTPLLRSEWQSKHPELMALDANLRFAQAEVLAQMRDPRRVQDVMEEIEARFASRGGMLVEYPIGEQSTLADALKLLEERKWRG